MKERRFGRMESITLPRDLRADCEVIQFDRDGTPHSHPIDEIAICVTGSGWVQIDHTRHRVEPGDWVRIPAGSPHYMIPDPGGMAMFIGYSR